jgi:chemotaxis protein MotB
MGYFMDTTTEKSATNSRLYGWLALVIALVVAVAYLQRHWQDENNSLIAALDDSVASNLALQDQLSETNDALTRLKAASQVTQSDQVTLNGVIQQLQQALDALGQEQVLATLTLHDRQEALEQQRATTKALQTELMDTTAQLQLQKSLYEKLTQQYQAQLERLSDLSQSHQSIESQFLNAREQIALQQSKTADYSATIEELQEALASENAAMDELASMLSELTENNQELVQKLEDGSTMIALPERVLFQSGSAKINDQGKKTLGLLVTALKSFPNHVISVQGHSDSRPLSRNLQAQYPTNWELSAARAAAAVNILLDKGIAGQRLQAVGFANSRPLVVEVDDDTRALNRRIEILLVPQLNLKSQTQGG